MFSLKKNLEIDFFFRCQRNLINYCKYVEEVPKKISRLTQNCYSCSCLSKQEKGHHKTSTSIWCFLDVVAKEDFDSQNSVHLKKPRLAKKKKKTPLWYKMFSHDCSQSLEWYPWMVWEPKQMKSPNSGERSRCRKPRISWTANISWQKEEWIVQSAKGRTITAHTVGSACLLRRTIYSP